MAPPPKDNSLLEPFREAYEIPLCIKMRWARKFDDESPNPDEAFITLGQLKAGLRLPLHPFVKTVLSHYDIAPGQPNGNMWRILSGLAAAIDNGEHLFTLQEVIDNYQCRRCPTRKKHFYFVPNSGCGHLVEGIQDTDKDWYNGYVFVSGNIDYGEAPKKVGPVVRRKFNRRWSPPLIFFPFLGLDRPPKSGLYSQGQSGSSSRAGRAASPAPEAPAPR